MDKDAAALAPRPFLLAERLDDEDGTVGPRTVGMDRILVRSHLIPCLAERRKVEDSSRSDQNQAGLIDYRCADKKKKKKVGELRGDIGAIR
jgi:hypothetical protein